MGCTATGTMTPYNKINEFLIGSDEVYPAEFKDKNGDRILDPTDFAIEFFIENRTNVSWICYRDGAGAPVNCEIQGDGTVLFYLPKDTFVEGALLCEINTSKEWTGYPPSGIFTRKKIMYTGFRYIQGR